MTSAELRTILRDDPQFPIALELNMDGTITTVALGIDEASQLLLNLANILKTQETVGKFVCAPKQLH